MDQNTVVEDPMGNLMTTTYDGDGEAIQVVDPMGRITTAGYDNRGWVAPVTDPLGKITTFSYTPTGQTSQVSHPGSGGGSTDVYTYGTEQQFSANFEHGGGATLTDCASPLS
jgi:YD repeat-containing protein